MIDEAAEDPLEDPGVRLMLAVQEGKESAFRELVERYQGAAFAMLRRLLGAHPALEDLAQETFLRVWRSRERYRPQGKFTTYLYRISYNLALNQQRGDKRKPLYQMPRAEDGQLLEPEDATGPPPTANAQEADWAALLEQCLAELPQNQRAALVFQHYDGLSLAEVAEILNVSEKAVKSLLHRARTRLRELLAPYHQAEHD